MHFPRCSIHSGNPTVADVLRILASAHHRRGAVRAGDDGAVGEAPAQIGHQP